MTHCETNTVSMFNDHRFDLVLKSHLNTPILPLMIWGEQGVGVTHHVTSIARELGMEVAVIRLGQIDTVGDLDVSSLFQTQGDAKMVIMFDDLPNSTAVGLTIVHEVLKGTLRGKELPSGIPVVATGLLRSKMPMFCLNRFFHMYVK